MATKRNMAASFNPSNDRLLGPNTLLGGKGLSGAYDDSKANNIYDNILSNADENRESAEEQEQPKSTQKKQGTDRAASLLEGFKEDKAKRPKSSGYSRHISMNVDSAKPSFRDIFKKKASICDEFQAIKMNTQSGSNKISKSYIILQVGVSWMLKIETS